MDSEGGTGTCGARGMTDADGVVLSESGWHPGDVVPFMLTRAWLEVEDGTSQKGVDDRLLEWGDNAGVNGGVHESVFYHVEAVGEDIVVLGDVHVVLLRSVSFSN